MFEVMTAMLKAPDLSVVVPCYDEESNISPLCTRISKVCEDVVDGSFEIVLVNDGSRDGTWAEIVVQHQRDARVIGVALSRNYGHQLALSAGLDVALGDRIFILDADLQDPPELLGAMMAVMDLGHDVVYGQRIDRTGETWFKRLTAKAFYRLLRTLSDVPIPVDSGDFRLLSRRVVDILKAMPEHGRFVRGMIAWTGFSQAAFPYSRDARLAGRSKYPLFRMIVFSLDAITAFSIRPLRVAILLGAVFGGGGFLMLGYALFSWATGSTVTGWTSLMATLLILGSLQLMVLGIVGEYVGRLVVESKGRPLFIVRSVLRRQNDVPLVSRCLD